MRRFRPSGPEAEVSEAAGRVLVVDDNVVNRKQLARLLTDRGYSVTLAEDGTAAVHLLSGPGSTAFDVILLDILMPGMDGYQVLAHVKGQPPLRHIPVIMISALDEMDSVVRCIELGATDYLPKPFKPALLQARLHASLAEKRLRDLELEYLEQAGRVADAAQDVEKGRFDPATLDLVAGREDALGRLARVFQRMAREVYLREQRLQRQLEQLRLDMDEMRRGSAEPASVWLPRDRQQALVTGHALPDRTRGAALFADISGFTPLTAALTHELGLRRGAEELTRAINQVYNAVVAEVHRYGGSVIGFAGDSITCWLDQDDGRRGLACALAMQEAMKLCASVTTPQGASFAMSIKIAVVAGPARRFLVGDPLHSLIEVVAGSTLDRLAFAESCAARGDVIAGAEIVELLTGRIRVAGWHVCSVTGEQFALITGLDDTVLPASWPPLPAGALPDSQCQPWLLPAVYERLQSGSRGFLADLRPVAALFLNFRGIDYDGDERAGEKLDAYIRWAQGVAARFDGAVIQVTIGDKGSYLAIAFGAPVSHNDDECRAVRAAQTLIAPPPELSFIAGTHIGIAAGLARAGAYGSTTRRTYGIQGDRVNLAARLMQAAPEGGILCDDSVRAAAGGSIRFEALTPIAVKGRSELVSVNRPLEGEVEPDSAAVPSLAPSVRDRLDALSPSEQLVFKVASVLGMTFAPDVLTAVFPVDSEKARLPDRLAALERADLIRRQWPDDLYNFSDSAIQEAAYNAMLFAQRRTLHRQVAEWYEQTYAPRLAPHYSTLAHHWRAGEEPAKAIAYLEKAAARSREDGDLAAAERLLQLSVQLEAETSVLSAGYYGEERLGAPDYEGAVRYAVSRLEQELSPDFRYHTVWHTRDEVMPGARRLAQMSGLTEEETRLAELGAAYHDLGFVVEPRDHERAGANTAAQVLPGFGFSSEQVAQVQGIILATRLPQSPRTPLEDVVVDADLDSLGRSDFPARSAALLAESRLFGSRYTDEEWNTRQLRFMLNHSYFTEAARELRNAGKQENIAWLQGELASLRKAGVPARQEDSNRA
jgi:CheY-like chemotaxis protein/class 3 adenylate cyclase/predicted metal-dependent HD superfamily phosphohydrolase